MCCTRFSPSTPPEWDSAANSDYKEPFIRTYNLCLLGYGNVNRALVGLLEKKQTELRDLQIEYRITGIAAVA